MIKYVLKRILAFVPVIVAVAILIFTVMYFVPGDPATVVAGPNASEEEVIRIRESMGLNQPYLMRLGNYLNDVFLHFDFGESYVTNVSITDEILRRLPRTMALGMSSFMVTLLLGIPLGILAGVKQDRLGDRLTMFIAMLGVSMPQFWLGLLLVLLFSIKLHLLPSGGIGNFTFYILPVLANCWSGVASNARQSRSAMLEIIRSDYITTARAKGISSQKVIFKHALPNALIPILATSSIGLAHVFGGSVVVETVFSIPGIGLYLISGVNSRDYAVVQACIIILAIIFAVVMLLVDVIYAFVDPKIKAKYLGTK